MDRWDILSWPVFRMPVSSRRRRRAARCIRQNMHRFASRPAALILACVLLCLSMAPARADVGGEEYSPGQCPYPSVGPFGFDGIAQHYACDFPTEINGSHHRCLFGGVITTLTGGVNLLIFNVGIQQPVGVLEGNCYWSCPDGSLAGEPNPVQTWQGSSSATTPVVRSRCVPIGPPPRVAGMQEPPPDQNGSPGVIPQQQPVGAEPGGGPT